VGRDPDPLAIPRAIAAAVSFVGSMGAGHEISPVNTERVFYAPGLPSKHLY